MSNATAAARKGGRFVVRCDEYTTKPFATEAAARRELGAIVAAGRCHREHEVVALSA